MVSVLINLGCAVVICGKCTDQLRVCYSNLVSVLINLGCAVVICGKCTDQLRVCCSNLW